MTQFSSSSSSPSPSSASGFRAEYKSHGRAEVQREIDPDDIEIFDLEDFLMLDLPDPEMLLDPILPAEGLMMLYAAAGIGKTMVGIGAALAIATGTQFLRWTAPAPKRVLYIDGEMRGKMFQQRLAEARRLSGKARPRYFNVLNTQTLRVVLPDLAAPLGQDLIEYKLERLGGVDVVVFDNLSSLCRAILENEGDSWQPMQDWLLSLRRRGVSVIIVHHASKGGTARGTSRRMDVLDTVIALRRPEDYSPRDGARFVVEIEKARGFYGEAAEPFEARLETIDGVPRWRVDSTIDPTVVEVARLLCEGWAQHKIAKELLISQTKVSLYKAKALELGMPVEPSGRSQR